MPLPYSTNPRLQLVVQRLFDNNPLRLNEWLSSAGNSVTQRPKPCDAEQLAPTPIRFPGTVKTAHQYIQDESEQLNAICHAVRLNGFAYYQWTDTPEDPASALTNLLEALSLSGGDSGVIRESAELSLLQDLSGTPKGRFPPYQSSAMGWHTDGYYNAQQDAIRSFSLHCIEAAASGGALRLMDDNLLILALFKEDIDLIALLSHPEAMTLPANKDDLGHNRPDRTVAMIQKQNDNSLTMRFTTRSKNIQWRCAATRAAAEHAANLIDQHPHWQTRLLLRCGEGVITRNVLHTREPFQDVANGASRKVLRGRFRTLPQIKAISHPDTVKNHHASR